MGRIGFYAINATGLYLIMSREADAPPDRLIFGFILIAIGTLGILAINFWPRKKDAGESGSSKTGN